MTLKCTCVSECILQLQFHALEVEERELLLGFQAASARCSHFSDVTPKLQVDSSCILDDESKVGF